MCCGACLSGRGVLRAFSACVVLSSPVVCGHPGGYAWSLSSTIEPAAFLPDGEGWFHAKQGFEGHLGEEPFFTIGVGRRWMSWFDAEMAYTFYQTFHYQRYFTPLPPFEGQRTQFFDLDAQNLIFSLLFDPSQHICASFWGLRFIPVFGGGIGLGLNRIHHFIETAYAFVGESGSQILIGELTTNVLFAWQAQFALRIRPEYNHFSFDLGYRYNGNGRFSGPTEFMANNVFFKGSQARIPPWKGRLQTHSIYLSFNAEW